MVEKMMQNNSILETAMQASVLKNDVILNNISNVDTPGFKKKTVLFDNILSDVLENAKRDGVLTLDKAKPQVQVVHGNFKTRLDENNVDIELEMVDLYENSVKYDTMVGSVLNNYKRINLVMRAK